MFAPRTFDVGCSTFAVCLWRRTSKLHPFLDCHTDRHTEKLFSATFPFPYWLLLLGGDVELNPAWSGTLWQRLVLKMHSTRIQFNSPGSLF